MDEERLLNPDVREVAYGKKVLKKLTLYPLSIGDQFKVTNIVTQVIQNLVSGKDAGQLTDFVFMSAVMKALESNLGKILVLIADIPEAKAKIVISELTNSQLLDIVDSIWTVDYEPALKKGKGLYEKGRKVFASERPLPSSSSAILNTGLKMSTDEALEKVD